jgi:hypothetical protein
VLDGQIRLALCDLPEAPRVTFVDAVPDPAAAAPAAPAATEAAPASGAAPEAPKPN